MTLNDDLLKAALNMVERTGAIQVQIRHSDEDDDPIVWTAIAGHNIGPDGKPRAELDGTRRVWHVGASLNPATAVIKLIEEIIDRGRCAHCSRPTGVSTDFDTMPENELICWYQYDPELKTFRRGCE